MRRRCMVSVLVALAVVGGFETGWAQSRPASATSARAPSAPAATAPEAVLIILELRLADLASVTVPAYRVGDEPLIPLAPLLQLAEIRHEVHSNGTIEAIVEPGSLPLVVTPADDVMRYGRRQVVIAPELKLLRGGELFVGVRPLAELLGLQVVVDWPELAVTITDPGSLPIARRLAREAARQELLRRGDVAGGPTLSYPLQRPRWDGLVVDYTVSAPSTDPLRTGSYSLATGMNAFGGSLEAAVIGAGIAPSRGTHSTASWSGVWADNKWVKQVRFGDGISTGPSPRGLRGATITNSPFVRSTYFGTNRFAGLIAPGWQVEAYRGSQLIAFDSTDVVGHFAVPIPAQYGENPVDFVAYGPFGEVRRFNRMYRVSGELLPAGQFEYGLSAGSCVGQTCAGTANVDLRYGISPRWTVRAGYDGFRRDTLASLSHPYAGVAGSLTDAIGLQVEGVSGASTRGLVRYEPSSSLRMAAEYTHFARDVSAPMLTPVGWRGRWLVSGLLRPRGPASSVYVEADAAHVETVTGPMVRARFVTSAAWRDVRVSPYVRHERDALAGASAPRSFVGVNTYVLPRPSWAGAMGHAWVRATLEVERAAGLSEASMAVARQLARGVRVEAGGRWTPTSAAVTLLTAVDLSAVRSYTTVIVPRAGAASAGEYVQGSIVVNTATRSITLAPGPSLQRSGVVGRVFLDRNTNGLLDAGEPVVPSVTVRVGTAAATSDSTGWFEVWNVAPFAPALVTVDSLSLPSPLWIPSFTTMTVVPGPNRFAVIDVPIVPGGVVEGRVLLETQAGRQSIGNAQLTLIDRRTGARRVLSTFGDGEFIAVAVRPGSYDVMLDRELLARLEATADPVRFTLPADPDGASVTGVEVIVRPVAPPSIELSGRARPNVVAAPPAGQPVPAPAAPTPEPAGAPVPPARSTEPPPQRKRAPAAPPAERRPPVPYTVYTVRPHDTLRDIARRLLGSEQRWIEIYQLNRSQIRRPDLIHPRQRLRIDTRRADGGTGTR